MPARRAEARNIVLLLDVSGAVAEGPTWNVFWRRGQRVRFEVRQGERGPEAVAVHAI